MRHSKYFLSIVPAGFFFLANAACALPFSIIPNGTLPTTVSPGSTMLASYTITNITNFNPPSNLVKWLPPNVAVNLAGTTCTPTSAFRLAPNQSCILNLTVSGPVSNTDPDPHHHLFVCMSDQATCAGPTPENSLNVTVGQSVRTAYTAVGYYYTSGTSEYSALSYISMDGGKNWAISMTIPPAQGLYNYLVGVACSNTGQQCTAVGSYYNGSTFIPASYMSTDGGNTWIVSATQPAQNETDDYLGGVACSNSGLQCAAVGSYSNGSYQVPLSYTSADGGNHWALSSTLPPPVGSTTDELASIACSSDGLQCATIGHTGNSQNTAPVSYTSTDGGNTWTVSTILPPLPPSAVDTLLTGIACSSTGLICTAVGAYTNASSISVPLSYTTTDGGNTWALSTPTPPAQGSSSNYLESVACDTSGLLCTAVGYYISGTIDVPLSFTSTNGGSSWTVSTTLPPSQYSDSNYLSSVACDGSGQLCTAVGYYYTGSTYGTISYFSTDGGKDWTISTTQPPAQGSYGSVPYGVA